MAPALTQDSQPELLLPYLSTPPYTPSPPSSGGGNTTNAPSVLHHHHYHHYHLNSNNIRNSDCDTTTTTNTNNHHSVSCSNMEDGPSEGLDDQHHHQTLLRRHAIARDNIKGEEAVIILEQREDEISLFSTASHNTHHRESHHLLHHHHHHLDLDQGDDDDKKFKREDLDEGSRSITLNQPTPPHSTDSSAPLSPLPGDKTNTSTGRGSHAHLLDGGDETSPEFEAGRVLSPVHPLPDTNKPPSFLSVTSQKPVDIFGLSAPRLHQHTKEESNHPSIAERSKSLGHHYLIDEISDLPSPHSPQQTQTSAAANTCDLTSTSDTDQPILPATSAQSPLVAPAVPVHSAEDLALCTQPLRCTATLAPTPQLVGPRSSTSVEVGEVVRPLENTTTIVVSPPATSISSPLGGGSSASGDQVVAAMGCTLPLVESKVAVRCPAPQPNDTPPPTAYLPKINSAVLSAATTTDLNYDNFIPILPDEFFMSLNHLVSNNPELLDQLNPTSTSLAGLSTTTSVTTTTSSQLNVSSGSSSRVPLTPEAPSSFTLSSQTPLSNVTSTGNVPLTGVAGGASQGLNMCVATPAATITPEQQASALASSLAMRQLRLQKRQAQVLRRLRRYTGRGLAAGISQQLRELVKQAPALVNGGDKQELQTSSSSIYGEEVTTASVVGARDTTVQTVSSPPVVQQPPRYDTSALKSMSTAKLITYVRRMETRSSTTTAPQPSGTPSMSHNSCSSSSSKSDSATSQRYKEDDVSCGYLENEQPCLPARVRSELSSVASEMGAAARLHVEHDSDATESSSGGESCDEMEGFDDHLHTHSKPIATRALFRHAAQRAWIAARWTWLEAQLADVECKIHQHNRAHMRLRHLSRSITNKTDLYHQQPPSSSAAGSATSAGVNPAMLSRPSYTCLTRPTQHHQNSNITSNSNTTTTTNLHQSIAAHNANTSSTSNGSTTFNGSNTTTSSSASTGSSGTSSSHSSLPSGGADAPSSSAAAAGGGALPTVSPCCDSGSARTSGYRWHRKRRWIRVGTVFERGDACSGGAGSPHIDLKEGIKRIKTSPSNTLSNNNNVVHNKNNPSNIKTNDCSGNINNSVGVDKKIGLTDGVVRQPTFAVSCDCVPPYSCVMCTRLPSKGAIVSAALLGDRTSLATNCCTTNNNSSNNKNISNKLFHHHHLLSSLKSAKAPTFPSSAAAVSSNPAFSLSPRHHTHNSLSPQQGPLSPLKSLTPSWPLDALPNTKSSLLFSRQQRPAGLGSRGTDSLCKSAWFPRVPSSSRTCLNTQPRHVPLPERLGQHDYAYHPVLSHPSEILQSTRLESVLKSKCWMKKLVSLQNPSSLLSQRQTSIASSFHQSRISSSTYKESVSLCDSATANTSQYGPTSTDASTRIGAPLFSDATDQLPYHHKSSSSHSKKKKKNKDRDRNREGRRKDKKKKAYKRKEKEAKKGRLTLQGDSHHSRSSGRVGSCHTIPPLLSLCADGDSSSLYSSSRASSPSLPPHSPAATLSDHGSYHRGNVAYGPGDAKGAGTSCYPNNNNYNKHSSKGSAHDKPSKTVTYSDKVVRNSGGCGGTPMDTDGESCAADASSVAGGVLATSVSSPAYATRRTSTFASSGGGSAGVSGGGGGSGSASSAATAASQQPLTPAAADAMTFKKKQGTASYDIDNIVIPYNMATVTRVEPIEYKEIVTPKWSEVEEPEPLDVRDLDLLEEDVSEPTVLARHLRSEELERDRFAAHMSTGGTRHGGNARTRQRNAMGTITATGGSSSAGTNTPDNPLSPHVDAAEPASPMVSPPSTPLPLSEDSNQSSASGAPKQHPPSGLVRGNASGTAFPEESSLAAEGDGATAALAVKPAASTDTTTASLANVIVEQVVVLTTTGITVTSTSSTTSQKSSTTSCTGQTTTMKTVSHNAPIVISSPFLENLSHNAETVLTSTVCEDDGLSDIVETTNISTPENIVDVTAEQVIPSALSVPNNDAATFKTAGIAATTSSAAASRRLRSNSSGLRPRSFSIGTAASQAPEDEHDSREVSPFPMRQFPLGESQYDSMLRENSEASVHPLPAAAHRTLLHPLDYDHLGESSDDDDDDDDDDEEEDISVMGDGEADEAESMFIAGVRDTVTHKSTKRKLSSDAGNYVPTMPGSKRKPKRHSSPALRHSSSTVLTNHNAKTGMSAVSGILDHTGRNNKKVEDTLLRLSQHNLVEHSGRMAAARRNVPVTISLKDINAMSVTKSDNSEGRCSPLSEATDSAAEDDTTGDLLSSDGGRPDWTISATADSTGHCVMQVLRH